ncbi:hypothetical protein [Sphingomonas sp. Leaf198]|uniref:hypothetical protein n=1 Tax=Sphingomonas sp. Leaf198 TaxID=1736299 RepID=UPI0006F6E51C|nr:hypothetical protein [Sphingomonas sp. Leaf198]KQS47046.1 hypothetical protein ASG20_17610 [Sphingomonas sp. Leaf198]
MLTLLLYGALGGLLVLLPYWLIVGGGIHTDQVGFALLPFSIVIGTASGFNSAIPRTRGLIATALTRAVVAASVVQLTSAFHTAALLTERSR